MEYHVLTAFMGSLFLLLLCFLFNSNQFLLPNLLLLEALPTTWLRSSGNRIALPCPCHVPAISWHSRLFPMSPLSFITTLAKQSSEIQQNLPSINVTAFYLLFPNIKKMPWGAPEWLSQVSIQLHSAQAMISWFMSLSPTLGSALAVGSLFLPLCRSPSHALSLSQSKQINKL